MEIIHQKIQQVRRRLQFIYFLDCLSLGFIISLIFICLYLGIDKFAHWTWNLPLVITILFGIGFLIGIILYFRHQITIQKTAVFIDIAMQLKERISSALEFIDKKEISPMISKLLDDANQHANRVNPKQILPFSYPKYFQWLVGLMVVAVILGFVPYYHSEVRKAQLITMKTIHQQGKKLEELGKKQAEEAKGQNLKELKNTAKRLEEVGKALQQPKINEKEALAKLAKLSEELRKTQEQFPTEKGMQEAMKNLAKANTAMGKFGESLKEGKLQAAQMQLQEMKQKLEKGELSKEEMAEMAKELKQIKGAMKDSQLENFEKSLEDMANAMAAGDMKDAQAAVDLSQKELEELAKSFEEAEKMAQAIDEAEASKMEIAQAASGMGQGGGQGSGEGIGAAASGQGSGGMAAVGTGKGKPILAFGEGGGPDAGTEITNLDQGGSGTASKETPFYNRQSGDKNERTGEYIQLYDPKYMQNKTYDTRVKGKMGEGKMNEVGETSSKPSPATGYVPYSEIYKDSRQEAEDALEKEDIPLGYKEYVKDYFESIDPNK